MYHDLVPVPAWRAWRLSLTLVGLVGLGCGDAHWASLRWPSAQDDAPRQPTLEDPALGLAVAATRVDYEPEGVVVWLTVSNLGDGALVIDRAGILLSWDELEYPVDADTSGSVELAPGDGVELRLRYELGRTLSGAGELVFRSLTRDGVELVELPRLELPAMPVT